MAITYTIPDIPEAPSRSDPQNFDERADAFLSRIETLDEDLNTWASQCNQTQTEINQARDDAYTYKDYAYKWATESEDTQVSDDVNTGYSAYHWAKKAYKWANTAEDTQVTDGEHTGYSAYHWAKKAETYRDQTYQWANADEDVLVDDGTHQGYSAYHYYQKIQSIVANTNFKGEWDSATTYNTGESVSYDGIVWISIVDNNQGVEPGSDDTKWASLGKKYDWDLLEIQNKLYGLVTIPTPYGIPYLDESGYIDNYISQNWVDNTFQSTFSNHFSTVSDFTFTANTVYQAQDNTVIYAVIGSADVTYTFGSSNPPSQTLTLKANNTISLVVPKGFYVQFSADTSAKVLSKEGSNVFV